MKQRDSNIELLRIVSMLMIVAYHLISNGLLKFNGNGTYDIWANGSVMNKIFSAFFYPGGAVGNMLFFMITGYFLAGCNKVRSFKTIVTETIFYSSGLCLLFLFLKYGIKIAIHNYGGGKTMLSSFFLPVTGGRNWFATAYILLLLLIPVLNVFFDSLNKTRLVVFLLFFDFFVAGLGYFLSVPFYDLYITIFYYGCGVFVKRFVCIDNEKKIHLLLCSFLFWCITAFVAYGFFLFNTQGETLYSMICVWFLRTTFAPLCAFFFFAFMVSLKIGEKKVINLIASSTFAVYLIHGSVFQRMIWDNIFQINTIVYQKKCFPLLSIFIVIVIFISCFCIDFLLKMIVKKINSKFRRNV